MKELKNGFTWHHRSFTSFSTVIWIVIMIGNLISKEDFKAGLMQEPTYACSTILPASLLFFLYKREYTIFLVVKEP